MALPPVRLAPSSDAQDWFPEYGIGLLPKESEIKMVEVMADYHCPAHGKACEPQPYDFSPPTEEDREWTHHNGIAPPGLAGILCLFKWLGALERDCK